LFLGHGSRGGVQDWLPAVPISYTICRRGQP
jgi:hypothetical protein